MHSETRPSAVRRTSSPTPSPPLPDIIMSRALRLATAAVLATIAAATLPPTLGAQDSGESHSGPRARKVISIGNYPRVDGIRINYRDREVDLVRGANITIWTPYNDFSGGLMQGVALGLPITMAGELQGIGLGIFGAGAESDARGIVVGGIGAGVGGNLRGIALGGIGVGAGGDVRGIAAGGIGVGSGGDLRGIAFGGVGAGVGGSVRGAAAGGIGVGVGGNLRGIAAGGIGVGVGGDMRGLMAGGIGVGAGGSARGILIGGVGVGVGSQIRGITVSGLAAGAGDGITGITVAGLAVGSGGSLNGITVAGLGVGAPRIRGAAAALMVGAASTRGIVFAPALFRTERGGRMTGASISSVNAIRGSQRGLTIGLVNYAERLNGVQLGAININRDARAPFKVLPFINVGRSR